MRRRGFTLLEVLISILVLILCIVGILPIITVAMRSQKRALDNASANTIARQVLSEVQEALDNPRPRDLRDRPIPGFPDTFKYDATFSPVTPPDPAESTFVVRVTVKWVYEGVAQSWEFQSVMMRKLDHTDLPAGPAGPAGPATPTTAPPKPKPEPNVDFSRKGLDVVSNTRYLPPAGVRVVEAAVEAAETRARSSIGGWDTKHSQKGSRGVSIFFIQPMNGEKTDDGQFIYAVNLAAVWFPFEGAGVTDPRAIHTVRREVYVDGKRSQNNSHETRLEDPRSADDPFFARQKQIDRGPEGAGSKLGAKGVMAWDSPGITGPWAEVQDYEVRIRWTGVTWIIGKTDKDPNQPAGYFRWSVVLEGRVGSGPTDTKLVARLEAVAFVETTEGDETLRRYLPKGQ
ncbi:MAG TPA: type II secretion system protein [Planctomycetota bacterium]|nr:type II secretion system protein [Planctomycetota bacterium]